MSKRDVAFLIAFLFWPILFICSLTVMKSWPEPARQMMMLSGLSVATFYVGLDLMIAPKTSLFFRVEKMFPFSNHTPDTVRLTGIVAILIGLMFGWGFLRLLLNTP